MAGPTPILISPARHRARIPWRTSLWPVPLLFALAAFVLALATTGLDALGPRLEIPVLGTRLAGEVVAITGTVAGAAATVLALVVTLTVTVLSNAGQVFGQRLIRNFVRARITKVTLGLFVAATVYSLIVMYRVTAFPLDQARPSLSAVISIALILAAVVSLVFYINHVAAELQAPAVIASVAHDLWTTIDQQRESWGRAQDRAAGGAAASEAKAKLQASGVPILTDRSGYVERIDAGALYRVAEELDAVVQLTRRPGHFVLYRSPIAVVWPLEHAAAVAAVLAEGFRVGRYRTLEQDLKFAIDQMVEVAVRALSPAVNDVFTGIQAIDWLGDALLSLAGSPPPVPVIADEAGTARLLLPVLTYRRAVTAAFNKIRQSAGHMPPISIRLLETIERLAEALTRPDQRDALGDEADMVTIAALRAGPVPYDRVAIVEAYRGACAALGKAPTALELQ
jgi:uncharacterized membrane protein